MPARVALAELLRAIPAPLTARELGQQLRLSESEVLEHLEHLERSARAHDERLLVEPASCLACDFVFAKRSRLGRPGRCPVCSGQRLTTPAFRIVRR